MLLGVVCLVGIVPVATWIGGGKRQAWQALIGYGAFVLGLLFIMTWGAIAGLLAALMS